MSERRQFGADSTTSDVLAGIDLSGKVALVTGGSGGLGEETARAFAEKGVRVVLIARNLTKGEAAAQAIRASAGNHEAEVGELELEFSLSGPDPLTGSLSGPDPLAWFYMASSLSQASPGHLRSGRRAAVRACSAAPWTGRRSAARLGVNWQDVLPEVRRER